MITEIGVVVGWLFGVVTSYFLQPGLYRFSTSFWGYIGSLPYTLVGFRVPGYDGPFSSEIGQEVLRNNAWMTMIAFTCVGALIGYMINRTKLLSVQIFQQRL